jgi:hypothetical protein
MATCSTCNGTGQSGTIKTYHPVTGKVTSKKPVACRDCPKGTS